VVGGPTMSRKAGRSEGEQTAYLKAKIANSEALVKGLKLGFNDMASKSLALMKATATMSEAMISSVDTEKNSTVRETFMQLGDLLKQLVEDHHGTQVGKLKSVVGQLEPFETRCKSAQTVLQVYSKAAATLALKTKDAALAKDADVAMAEKELEGAQEQEQNAVEELTRTMQEFENERTRMLRTALGDFIHLHIEYHARALEKYTEMYKEHDRIAPEQIEDVVGLISSRPM